MAALALHDVSKLRKRKGGGPDALAVKSLSLGVRDGEIIALLGPSGCGKTSTLRMVAGLEAVNHGSIHLGERPIHALPPAQRDVAMAFDGDALYPPLTAYENIALGLQYGRTARDAVRRKVGRMAELLEITDILERHPAALSAGQRQRVGLARALVREASLHVLDAPLSQVEPSLRAALRWRIKAHLLENRMTAVFATQDQTEALASAHRVAVMCGGQLQQFASPDALRLRPANLFVAGTVGEPAMNLLPASVALSGGALAVVVPGRRGAALRVSFGDARNLHAAHALAEGAPLRLGVRPNKIRLGEARHGETPARGILSFKQWQGDQTHLGVDLDGCTLLVVSDCTVDIAPGSVVPVALPVEALHLFDPRSGQALLHGTDRVV